MTLGTSLFWITILLLCVFGIRKLNKNQRGNLLAKIDWGILAKAIRACLVLGVLLGLAVWAWVWNSERPRPIDTLGDLSLGMAPLDVSLAVGRPDTEIAAGKIDGSRRYLYTDSLGELQYFVKFSKTSENSSEQVEVICTQNYVHKVFGLGVFSSEDDVRNKLGEPTSQSIRKDGLAKILSYEKWRVSYEIERKNVIGVCISSSGKVHYLEEYGSGEQI